MAKREGTIKQVLEQLVDVRRTLSDMNSRLKQIELRLPGKGELSDIHDDVRRLKDHYANHEERIDALEARA